MTRVAGTFGGWRDDHAPANGTALISSLKACLMEVFHCRGWFLFKQSMTTLLLGESAAWDPFLSTIAMEEGGKANLSSGETRLPKPVNGRSINIAERGEIIRFALFTNAVNTCGVLLSSERCLGLE